MSQKIMGAWRFLFDCAAFVFSILTLTLAASSLPNRDPWFIDPAGKTGRIAAQSKLSVTAEEFEKMTDGGLEISSSNPILRKMNPRVSEITWSFK
jgi:hypothetical protein